MTAKNVTFQPIELIHTVIDGRENIAVGGDLNLRFRMLLKGACTVIRRIC